MTGGELHAISSSVEQSCTARAELQMIAGARSDAPPSDAGERRERTGPFVRGPIA